jgi:hypothetical protein
MSYDLQIWSVHPAPSSDVLPKPTTWIANGQLWTHERRDWQVVVGRSVKVLPEDVPEVVAQALPGIAYLTELSLSPFDAPETARKLLSRSAAAIGKAIHGVIFDPQADQVTLPSGIKRFARPGASESASVISMSWWFIEGPAARGEFGPLLDVLKAKLPEGLPRRYGSFEPPEHVFAETGREHFLTFLAEHLKGQIVVWYPSVPVSHVHLGLPEDIGASKRGFRSAYFTLDVDAEVLSQAGWQTALKHLWHSLSHILQPFYGDIRTRTGYRRNRGRYWLTRSTQRHPVTAWWWCGLPRGPAHAVVLGKPYDELWPAFARKAVAESGLLFADSDDWRVAQDMFERVGEEPPGLGQVSQASWPEVVPREYPANWPFGSPRLP